jgi:hypothetical protein
MNINLRWKKTLKGEFVDDGYSPAVPVKTQIGFELVQ